MHVTGLNSGYEIHVCWLHITTPKHTYLLLVVYHRPKRSYNSSLFIERLVADIDELACEYSDAIMYITGDFIRLNISKTLTDTGLSQMVLDCTRGRYIATCVKMYRCISTFLALNYRYFSRILLKSFCSPYVHNLFRRFFDFSQFSSAISRKLWPSWRTKWALSSDFEREIPSEEGKQNNVKIDPENRDTILVQVMSPRTNSAAASDRDKKKLETKTVVASGTMEQCIPARYSHGTGY